MFSKIIDFLLGLFAKKPAKITTVSQRGIDLIKEFEGLRLTAYRDAAGVLTIGYGHTKGVKENDRITAAQAERFLIDDIKAHAAPVINLVVVPLNQNQFDALVSFVYNLGGSAFANSTLLKHLNYGDYDAAAGEFDKWIYASGKPLNGLVKRRAKERLLFESKL